jgi:hypothetical protein
VDYILLILIYKLSDIMISLGIPEVIRPDRLLLLLFTIVRVDQNNDASLIAVFLKLLHVVGVYKGHVGFIEDFNSKLQVDMQFLLDLYTLI